VHHRVVLTSGWLYQEGFLRSLCWVELSAAVNMLGGGTKSRIINYKCEKNYQYVVGHHGKT